MVRLTILPRDRGPFLLWEGITPNPEVGHGAVNLTENAHIRPS